ncbi:MAG: gamma-glutamyltransferase [Candidatus Coatesbacteria bacterium]|nr:MAG: gamma-glutamyltransferase [Candidatus Coatesbacteria bacterium]
MVATAFPEATAAGVEILREGGNAVDAACAAALALAVCEPQASGLGGQTMILLRTAEGVTALDGSSRAPSLAHVEAVSREERAVGYRATTVPSTPATLAYAQERYGRLPWRRVVEPAIRLAREGYRITALQRRLQELHGDDFGDVPSGSGARYFLDDGKPFREGALFRQADLAHVLETLAEKGVEEFYGGDVAREIDADMREHGGLLRYDDLALIPWPIARRPLRRRFRGFTIRTMPLPAAGRTLLFTLMMLNLVRPRHLNEDEVKRGLLLVEILRKALLERSDRPFDPDFYPQLPEKDMLDAAYVRASIRDIMADKHVRMPIRETEDEVGGETTHLSVADSEGNAVSLTQSIERVYGSKAAAAGLGFLYNNYLLDFDSRLPSHPYYLRPNAVPWAAVCPTLVFDDREFVLALGSPGSERSIAALAQFLIHVVDEKMPLGEAMAAPRLHCSLGGAVSLEGARFPAAVAEELRRRGYRVKERRPFSFFLGAIQAVWKRQTGPGFHGVADVRRDGTAAGL